MSRAMRRTLIGVTATAITLLVGALPAVATPDGQTSLGSVTVIRYGTTVSLDPIAQCDVNSQQANSSSGASAPGIASYGDGTTSCTRDTKAKTATMTLHGSQFELTALAHDDGPDITLSDYTATCAATATGTNVNFSFGNLTGISAPSPIPANYTVTVGSADHPQAKIILNEMTLANPNDGSVSVTMMHIVLYPNGGPLRGDVVVGATACSPVKG